MFFGLPGSDTRPNLQDQNSCYLRLLLQVTLAKAKEDSFDETKFHRGKAEKLRNLKGTKIFSMSFISFEYLYPRLGSVWRDICTSRAFRIAEFDLKYAVRQVWAY